MNTEIIIHPKLQHYGLITANLDTMIDWYRKVLGMTINHRSLVPARAVQQRHVVYRQQLTSLHYFW